MAHYDIYREELGRNFHAFGHALWEPSPGVLGDPVAIGDVGFIRQGKFQRIFNVLLPEDHQTHSNFGTPEYHEPLQLKMEIHVDEDELSPNDFYSAEVKVVSGGFKVLSSQKEGSAQVSFACSRKRGAALSLPVSIRRGDTLARGEFEKWIINHIDRWFYFMRSLGLGIEHMEDIILVTGYHRTRSYTNVIFSESQDDAQVSFSVRVGGSGADIEWRFSREQIGGVVVKCGPSGDNLLENQCIFVRGFRATRFLGIGIFPTTLRGAAEPGPDSDPHDSQPDKEPISVPASASRYYQDPLHILLRYIAEKEPNCDMAVVHDDDLGCIDGMSLKPDTFMGYLRNSQPRTHCYGLDNGGSPKAGASIKVAMLFERASKDLSIKLVTSSIAEPSPTQSLGTFSSSIDATQSLHSVGSTPPDTLLLPPSVIHTGKLSNKVPVSNITLPVHYTTDRRAEPSSTPSLASSTPVTVTQPTTGSTSTSLQSRFTSTARDSFLTDGYLAYTFSPLGAQNYLAIQFKVDPKTVQTFLHQGAFFVMNQPLLPDLTSPPLNFNGDLAWLLDYRIQPGGTVVPQQLWFPQGQGDLRRYVEQAPLQMPLFFIKENGSLGVPIVDAVAGQMFLRGARHPAPFGSKATIKIRIGWPGYATFEQQVQLKDQSPGKSPVTLDRFVRSVASRVRQFLADCERVHVHVQNPDRKWRVAPDNITFEEVILIGVVQVSAGSWMPILQLINRVVI